MNETYTWLRSVLRLTELGGDDTRIGEVLRGLCVACVELLPVSEAAATIAMADQEHRTAVFRSDAAWPQSLAADPARPGPARACLRSGTPLYDVDLGAAPPHWRAYVQSVAAHGITHTTVLPMRAGKDTVGVVQFLYAGRRPGHGDLLLAQCLADICVVQLAKMTEAFQAARTVDQLRTALVTRVVVEQAKGMLAASGDVHPDAAFQILRQFARSRRRRLHDVAREVVVGKLRLADLQH